MSTEQSVDYYLEDLPPGFSRSGGQWLLTAEDIIEFAKIYDPLPIHVDREAARNSQFGCLIAAGTHLLAIASALNHQLQGRNRYQFVAGLGYDNFTFVAPGKEGDILSLKMEVISSRRSNSDPRKGIVEIAQTLLNQHGETVISTRGKAMMWARPVATG